MKASELIVKLQAGITLAGDGPVVFHMDREMHPVEVQSCRDDAAGDGSGLHFLQMADGDGLPPLPSSGS